MSDLGLTAGAVNEGRSAIEPNAKTEETKRKRANKMITKIQDSENRLMLAVLVAVNVVCMLLSLF